MELKIFFIEDDDTLRENLVKVFHKTTIADYTILAEATGDFEKGIELIKNKDYDIVILDLFKDKDTKDEDAGEKVLIEIRKHLFVPVIFYTGHSHKIKHLVSAIVGVVNKGEGVEALTLEINRIITSKIALLKRNIIDHINESLRKYFWETVDTDKKIFVPDANDFSLGYLLLRRISNSLSKENIKSLLGDDKIKINKSHPMEFYIYPTVNGEFEAGEILLKDGIYYTIITPSCDFIAEGERKRKAERILLIVATKLTENDYYKDYVKNKNNENKIRLSRIIETRKGDRYFFLPGTPFIENLILDFQNNLIVNYEELKTFNRIAKLDNPFAQSMISSFIRYYNRIGSPDIDSEYVINNL